MRYELPDTGSCHVLVRGSCDPDVKCHPTYTVTSRPSAIAVRPGMGRIVGSAARDGKPLLGAGILVLRTGAVEDAYGGSGIVGDGGAFTIELEPGRYTLAVVGNVKRLEPQAEITVQAGVDTVVAIVVERCSCCDR